MNCEHDFKHLDTMYRKEYQNWGSPIYERVDRFFCAKCLEQKEVLKSEQGTGTPNWFKVEVRCKK